jgi:hypothetical protein
MLNCALASAHSLIAKTKPLMCALQVHYYLQLSEGDPKTDPITLWSNGGPGCTSLKGAFEELGQLVFNRDSISRNATAGEVGERFFSGAVPCTALCVVASSQTYSSNIGRALLVVQLSRVGPNAVLQPGRLDHALVNALLRAPYRRRVFVLRQLPRETWMYVCSE